MSDGGFDCVTVGVGDFYGGGDFDGGLDGGVGGCSRIAVAVAVMLIFHIAGIHIAGLNAPKSKTTSRWCLLCCDDGGAGR